ncbi:hypothetical protein P3W45_001125 [Vairimorpha bombi]
MIEIINSEKDAPMVICNNFTFRIASRTRTLSKWRCSIRYYSSRMVSSLSYEHDIISFSIPTPHLYTGNPEECIRRREVVSYCLRGVSNETIASAGKEEALYKALRGYKTRFINPKPHIFTNYRKIELGQWMFISYGILVSDDHHFKVFNIVGDWSNRPFLTIIATNRLLLHSDPTSNIARSSNTSNQGLCSPSLIDIRSTTRIPYLGLGTRKFPELLKGCICVEVLKKFADETRPTVSSPCKKIDALTSETRTIEADYLKARIKNGVRKFAVRPLTLSRTTLEDLPIFEESLRAKIIVECPISIRNKAKLKTSKETCFISILILNVHVLRSKIPEISLLPQKKVPTIDLVTGISSIETRDRGLVLASRRYPGLELTQYGQNE